MPNGLRVAIIAVVTMVWAVAFTAPIFVKGYVAPPEIHIALMAVIGVILALGRPDPPDSEDNPPPQDHG